MKANIKDIHDKKRRTKKDRDIINELKLKICMLDLMKTLLTRKRVSTTILTCCCIKSSLYTPTAGYTQNNFFVILCYQKIY